MYLYLLKFKRGNMMKIGVSCYIKSRFKSIENTYSDYGIDFENSLLVEAGKKTIRILERQLLEDYKKYSIDEECLKDRNGHTELRDVKIFDDIVDDIKYKQKKLPYKNIKIHKTNGDIIIKEDKKLQVIKHNNLIDCISDNYFSKFELQFIADALSKYYINNNSNNKINIELDNLYEECYGSILDGSTKISIINTLNKLVSKVFTIRDNDSCTMVTWFKYFKYERANKLATVEFSDNILKYISSMNKSITKIDRDIYMSMTTPYGLRLMELMSKIYTKTIITREFDIDELRKLLNVGDRHKLNYRFKTRVIEEAVKDINDNNPNFSLNYDVIKQGRNLKKFKFTKYNIKD